MRIILVKHYSVLKWRQTSEDLAPTSSSPMYKALKNNFKNHSELHILNMIRNFISSQNSYKILEVDQDDKDQILKVTFPLAKMEHWDFFINEALVIFKDEFQKTPQILLMNETTIAEIENVLPKEKNIFGAFESENGFLTVCIDNGISDFDFCLVCDEQAELT